MDYTVKVKDVFDLAPLFASMGEFVLPDVTRDLESRFWTLGRKVQRLQLLPSPILLYAPTTVKESDKKHYDSCDGHELEKVRKVIAEKLKSLFLSHFLGTGHLSFR